MQLIWNETEQGWVCSRCGAIYTEEEVARVFGYNGRGADNFTESYCMDCGGLWDSIQE